MSKGNEGKGCRCTYCESVFANDSELEKYFQTADDAVVSASEKEAADMENPSFSNGGEWFDCCPKCKTDKFLSDLD